VANAVSFRVLFGIGPEADFFLFDGLACGLGCGGGLAFFLGGALDVVAGEDFEGEVAVGFGSAGAGVVEGYGLAVAGSFGEADVAGDAGFEELFSEEAFEVFSDLLGEVGAVVVHGEEDAFEGEGGVEDLGDAVEGGHELGDAFEGEVLGLHGDEETVGGDEGVEGEEVEGGGAVEEDEGVVVADGGEGVAEAILAAVLADELDVGADEVFAARDEGEIGDFGGNDDVVGGGVAHEEVVDAEAGFVAGEAEASGGVGLGVAVYKEGRETFEGEGGGEVDGGGGFADTTFLVDDGDDLGGARRGGGGVCRAGCWRGGWSNGFIGGMDGDHRGR
jgi:hypothetical protein